MGLSSPVSCGVRKPRLKSIARAEGVAYCLSLLKTFAEPALRESNVLRVNSVEELPAMIFQCYFELKSKCLPEPCRRTRTKGTIISIPIHCSPLHGPLLKEARNHKCISSPCLLAF